VQNVFALNPSTTADAHTSKLVRARRQRWHRKRDGERRVGWERYFIELIGFQHDIRGGEGSAGLKGGSGGEVSKIVLRDGAESVRAENVTLNGGVAGSWPERQRR
jgi:hypothetical protein